MRIAVTGASGRLGAQVVDVLARSGDHDVVAVARRPPSRPVPSLRTTVELADYAEPAALRAALRGVETLVFISSDGEAVHVLRHHENVVQAAVAAGVTHVVALSGLDADTASPFCYGVTCGYTEQLLRASGCAFSIARASIFTEFFVQLLTAACADGELRLPAADGRISLVSRADVGCSLAALALDGPTGRVHELTGPDALGMGDVARAVAERWHTPVRYVDVPPAEHLLDMARDHLEPWWCYAFSSMFASVRQQRWTRVSDEVARLTSQTPRALHDLLTDPGPPSSAGAPDE